MLKNRIKNFDRLVFLREDRSVDTAICMKQEDTEGGVLYFKHCIFMRKCDVLT